VRAFHFDGVPASGWNARSRGRAAVPYPSPVGGLVTLHKEGVAGFSAEDELLLWDSQGVLQSHVIRQWPYRAVAPFSLGDRGPSAEPVFFLVGADSLQASLLSTPFHLPAQVTDWIGPQGGPEGRAWLEGRAIDPDYGLPSLNLYVYPNPARDRCTIRIEGLRGRVRVHAFTRSGTNLGLVADLVSPIWAAGEAVWDVSRLAPGVYFLVGEHELDGSVRRVRTTVLVVR